MGLSFSAPTATHVVAVGHETPSSPELPSGAGRVCTVHFVPFQRSAAGVPPSAPYSDPTAVHAVAELQDTSSRLTVWASATLAAVLLVPFQSSAKLSLPSPPVPPRPTPTAMQVVAVAQDKP